MNIIVGCTSNLRMLRRRLLKEDLAGRRTTARAERRFMDVVKEDMAAATPMATVQRRK